VNMKIRFVLPQMILCCSVVVQVTDEQDVRASLTGGSRTRWWSSMPRSRFVVFPSREGEKWRGGSQE
jgi:hypothetical protein